MKKLLFIAFLAFMLSPSIKAQVYTGAVGLGIDLPEGRTYVGPSGKYFFAENHAGSFDAGFADGATKLEALYLYHGLFTGTETLQWFVGSGPTLLMFNGGGSSVGLRFSGGLDFKIPDVPLAFSADWRPYLSLESGITDRFTAGVFCLGFRYAFD
jgi:hypothetical protein